MAKKLVHSVITVILCTILMTVSQFLYREGMQRWGFGLFKIAANYYLIAGMALYATVAIVIIYVLKEGEMSVLMPILATSYIWVVLGSALLYGEAISVEKLAGITLIAGGVSLIGIGGARKAKGVDST